ncbi:MULTISPECIES: HK97 gp10 family phage protein [Clostridia]|nr:MULTISPECIES: HK97 gp10 family phage protein [Clostridia]
MGRNGGCDFSELEAFQQKMETLANNMNANIEVLAKQTAALLLATAIKRTPVGRYDGKAYVCEGKLHHKGMRKTNGNNGSTLKKNWTSRVYRSGNLIALEIENPIEYASYVEYGHRTVNGGWAPGHHIMKFSVEEVQRNGFPKLERKIQRLVEAALR